MSDKRGGLPHNARIIVGIEDDDDIAKLCRYKKPEPEMQPDFDAVSNIIEYAVRVFKEHVPACPDRTVAIRHLLHARMVANSAIIFEGVDYIPKD